MYEVPDILGHMFEGVYIVDKHRRIVFWNKGSERITGYKSEEVVNKFCYNNILRHVTKDGKQLCFGGCPLHKTISDGIVNEGEVFLHHKSGHRVPVSVKTLPLYDDEGNITSAIEVFTDLRYQRDNYIENRELKELLSYDALTRVPNRRYLDFTLNNLQQEASEFNTTFGILFVDIDDFKNVNDTYGHNVGDGVLQVVANTLQSNVRANDTVGRWGGEEFICILKLDTLDNLSVLAEKLRLLVEQSAYKTEDGTIIKVTVSMGGTMFIDEESVSTLVDRADKLMYHSKQTGKNKVTIK